MKQLIINYRKKQRALAFLLLLIILNNTFFPTAAFALTGGPSQPEVQSFEPIGTSEMVDLFSGDFNYNIPLMDVDGYPINMSYHSGITMDQEASWVGLGWNINPGVVNRSMRGVPDDFNGEEIVKKNNLKENITVGVNAGFGAAVAGWEGLSLNVGFGVNYNSYVGVGVEQSVSLSFNVSKSGKGPLSSSLGLKSSNTDGLSVSPSVSFSSKSKNKAKGDQMGGSVGIGTSFNSRSGLKSLSISGGVNVTAKANTKNRSSIGVGSRSSSIDFGMETFVPHVNIPMRNSSVMFQAQFGGTLFSIDGTINASGYYSKSKIDQKTQSLPSYGYFYEHNGADMENVMLDFNREKDGGEFSVNTPGLPVTNHTYDIFNVNGQGVNGAYRLHRSDIGYVFDNKASSTNDSYALGVEVASGNTAQVGVDVSVTDVNTTSGKWNSDNQLADAKLKFLNSNSNKDYEPAYFKMAGEKVADLVPNGNTSMYESYGKNKELRALLGVGSDQFDLFAHKMLTESYDQNSFTAPANQINKRIPRAQEISYLKVKEKDFMLRPNDLSLQAGTSQNDQFAEISVLQPDGKRYVYGKALYNTVQKEVSFNASGNTVSCGNGLISYSGSDNSLNNDKGADNYFASTEIPRYAHSYLVTAVLSPDYIDMEKGPGKVGPSPGDFGDYTLFEYQQNTASNQPFSNAPSIEDRKYKWRTPLNENTANHNEGLKTKALDDQGNYVYGEKEVVYLKYIKTKNFVAVFELNDINSPTEKRLDGKGASDENGGVSSNNTDQSRYLKTITLYSRPDFEARVANPSYVPFPLKKVHFEYTYQLCKGIYNGAGGAATSGQGKLTLSKVYFTYGTSNKGKFSAYEFAYAGQNYGADGSVLTPLNPGYHPKGYNKWGYYKPVSPTGCSYTDDLTNSEYPYVEQDLTHTSSTANSIGIYSIAEDDNASAWSLTKIKLPSGGEIKVTYESDDYAYVQNKKAMEMFKMYDVKSYTDFTDNPTSGSPPLSPTDMETRTLANPKFGEDIGVVVKLKNTSRYNSNSNPVFAPSEADFKNLYLKDMIDAEAPIYFREYVKINGANNNGYEFVSGYAYIDINFANQNKLLKPVFNSTTGLTDYYAFIPLKTEQLNLGSKLSAQPQASPLVLAALKFARMHTSREAFSFAGEPQASLSAKNLILALADASFINTITQTFQGPEKYLYQTRNLGHHIIPGKSWIRLYNPYNDKLGGGSRVKQLLITDNWNTMDTNEPITNYGQEYDYSTYININGNSVRVSSGVTTYEPMVAADDNPFRMPNFSGSKSAPLAPDTRYYLEEPYGESFFPSPSVGYSDVRMRSVALNALGEPVPNVKNHSTGYTQHQFYTAKDYPVIVKRTDMNVKEAKSSLAGQLLKLDVKHYMTASQGFVVELNDMHGKPKGNWVYAEGQGAPISGIQYFYKDNAVATAANVPKTNGDRLMNDNVPVLDKDGFYKTQNTFVGLEYDMVADFRQEETVTITAGAQINLYIFYAGLPLMIPPVWPTYSKEATRLRTASFTKVINRYGILEETIVHQDGATIKTSNLLWDAETGEVLLTKTKNEFKDDIYSLNIPAHLGHKFMGPSYMNNMVEGDYSPTNTSIINYLVDGDELIVDIGGQKVKGYFYHNSTNQPVISTTATDVNVLSSVTHIKVLRSGRRNMQNISIGSVTFLRSNPLVNNLQTSAGGTYLNFNSFAPVNNILNANSTLFTDVAKIDCNCYTIPTNPNPYYWGLKGNWHAKESYLFLAERNRTTPSGTPTSDPTYKGSTRNDGTYSSFNPFWKILYGPNQTLNPDVTGWTWTNTLSIYSVEGQELENVDALNRFSAATFGYNNKLPLSVSNNSQYREVGYDGFEDYSFEQCTNPRFKFKNSSGVKAFPTNSRSHTGKYSIKVNAYGDKVELYKPISACTEVAAP